MKVLPGCLLAAACLFTLSCDSRPSGDKRLGKALQSGDTNFVQQFLDSGGNVNKVIQSHPHEVRSRALLLNIAVASGQRDLVAFLLKKGANPNAREPEVQTPLEAVIAQGRNEVPQETRMQILSMLLQAGADPNSGTNSAFWTPLCMAAELGETQMVSVLLAAGADVNATNNHGQTALHMANNAEVARLLIAGGADRNACSTYVDRGVTYLVTPADSALERGRFSVLAVLTNASPP